MAFAYSSVCLKLVLFTLNPAVLPASLKMSALKISIRDGQFILTAADVRLQHFFKKLSCLVKHKGRLSAILMTMG